MRPFADIAVGDIYQVAPGRLEWVVISKNDEDRLVELGTEYQHPYLPPTIWKRPTDPIFRRRVYP